MSDPVSIAIGRALRDLRATAGLSQYAFAERLGCAQSVVSKIETAQRPLYARELFSYAQALELTPQDLFEALCKAVDEWPEDSL